MSMFGSPEDDPLLKGDPLAFSSSPDLDEADDAQNADDRGPTDDVREGDSVFEPSKDYRIVRTVEEAANGQLSELNTSLNEEWILDRVELREAASSVSSTHTLVFVLHRLSSKD